MKHNDSFWKPSLECLLGLESGMVPHQGDYSISRGVTAFWQIFKSSMPLVTQSGTYLFGCMISPFFFHLIRGSGKPRGPWHSSSAVSPTATSVLLGLTRKSVRNTAMTKCADTLNIICINMQGGQWKISSSYLCPANETWSEKNGTHNTPLHFSRSRRIDSRYARLQR